MKNELAKKLANVFLAVLMLFSCFTVSLKAEETAGKHAELVTDLSEISDGSQFVIYHPTSKQVLTASASGSRLAGTPATISDGKMELTNSMALLTLSEDGSGKYSFINSDGRYLTSTGSGNNLSFGSENGDYSKWTLSTHNDGRRAITNVGAAYNNNHNQALEYYNGTFTTYGIKMNDDAYKFEFYVVKEDVTPEPGDPVLVSSVSLNQEALTLEEGKTAQLIASILPENADNKEVAWNSSDSGIATVDATGLVTAVTEGTATIIVSTKDGSDLSAQCAVSVTKAIEPGEPILVSSLTLDQTSLTLEEGKTSQLNASVLPEDATDKTLNWTSTDETIATVDATGLVTAVTEGTATIIVSTKDGSDLSAQCAVAVTKATEPEEPEDSEEGLVTDLSQLKDGSKVVIYNKARNLAMSSDTYRGWYLMPGSVTIEDDKVIEPAENLIWEVTVNEDGTYTFTQGDKTVGTWMSNTYVELTNDASQNGLDNKWTVVEKDSTNHRYYLNTAMEGGHGPIYLEVFTKNVNGSSQYVFCGYSTTTNTNLDAFGMQFYLVEETYSVTVSETVHGTVYVSDDKVKEGETVTITVTPDEGYELESLLINGVEQTVGADGTLVYTVNENITIKATFVEITGLVTDLSQLKDGSKVVIYNKARNLAMSSDTYRGWYLMPGSVTIEDDKVIEPAENLIWEVTVNEDGTYTFTQGDKTVGTWMSNTYVELTNDASQNGLDNKWTVVEKDSTNHRYYLNTAMEGGHGPIYLEVFTKNVNGSSQYVFCGYSTTTNTNLDAFGMQFYLVAHEDETPVDPTEDTFGYTTHLATGDKVIIYNSKAGRGITSNIKSVYNLDGFALTPEEGVITTDEDSVVWDVTANDDGTYTFTQGSKVFGGTQRVTDTKTYNNIVLSDPAASKWTVEESEEDFHLYLGDLPSSKTGGHIYLEWSDYNGNNYFQLYDYSNPGINADFVFSFYKQGAEPEDPSDPEILGDLIADQNDLDGATVVIYSPGHKTAVSSKPNGDWYLKAQEATVKDGKVINYTRDMVWNVKYEDGFYHFYAAYPEDEDHTEIAVWKSGEYMELTVNPYYDADTLCEWTLTQANEKKHTWYISNPALTNSEGNVCYIEAFERHKTEVFSGFCPRPGNLGDNEFAIQFYRVDKEAALEDYDGEPDGILRDGGEYVVYNYDAKSSLGLYREANYAFDAIPTQIVGNKAKPGNGAYVFKVHVIGRYYAFEINGQYLATNNKEELFFINPNSDGSIPNSAKWYLKDLNGWHLIFNKIHHYGGQPVCIEYFSSVFSGWTYKFKKPPENVDPIYQFKFYEVTDDSIVEDQIVQDPSVQFRCNDIRHLEEDFPVTISLDDLSDDIREISIRYIVGERTVEVTDYEVTSDKKNYTFTLKAEDIDNGEKPESFKIVVDVTNSYDISYSGEKEIMILDEPFFYDMDPAPNSQTGEDKRPVISVKVGNVGEDPTLRMIVKNEEVETVFEEKTLSYTPEEDFEDGRIIVKAYVTRKDGKTAEKTWSFMVGKSEYQLYFGQLHSHTTYSDGSGTLETALDYIASLPESANVDFVAFTDHSNYFDEPYAANPADAMNDASLMYPASAEKWHTYKQAVADFNARQNDIVAIAGFEMTWSGGPGHINSFNTQGLVSRNNTALNNKSLDEGMKLYYETMTKDHGETLHQFNHPGTTFGNFKDFSYRTDEIDERMFLVEVGNGEGQIGASGYYPSYEQYIMALDKGWHLAPTNNQDNHKGRWGNANDARDVVLTNDFSEEGIYDAIRALRVYATEDKNLEIGYKANGKQMGTIFPDDEMPEELNIEITLYDPDEKDSISKVELVSDHGRVAYTWTDPEEFKEGYLSATVVPTGIYYFVRVTQADGDLAVTSPIWVDSVLDLGIENVVVDPEMPTVNENATLTAILYNHEDVPVTVKSIVYTIIGDEVLASDNTARTLPANGMLNVDLTVKFKEAKHTPVTLTVVVSNGVDDMTLTRGLYVDVLSNNTAVTPIKTVRKNKNGATFTIEGIVTSNASGYDKDTAFFDCIYVQDESGGICAFPVSGEYKIGDKVRIIGYTDDYQGEPELQVISIEVIGEGSVEPREITAADLRRRIVEGQLVTLKGTVESYAEANGLTQTIMIRDEAGSLGRVFIDGYITTDYDVENLVTGAQIEATGLASYDNTFNAPDGPYPRIRIRDRRDIICTIDEQKEVLVQIKGNYATPEYDGTKHEVDGYKVVSISNSEYTEDDFTFTGTAHAEGVNACDNGNDRIMMGLTPEMFTNKNSAFIAKFEIVEDGYLEIMRRELFVSVDSKTKGFGEEDPEYTVSLRNQVEGEDEQIIEELDLAHNLTREEGEDIGTYRLTLNVPGSMLTNYNVNIVGAGSLTITKADLAIRISGNQAEYIYDGTAKKVKGYTVETELPEGVLVVYRLKKLLILTRTDVGVSKMNLAAEQFALEGPMAGNYNWTIEVVQDGMLTITPAPLDIHVIDQTYVFNGELQGEHDEPLSVYTDPEMIAAKIEVSGLIGEDKVTYLILDGARRDVGEYEREIDVTHISVNDVALFNNPKSNYYFHKQTGGKLTITPAKLTVTIIGNTAKYIYDGTIKTVRGFTVEKGTLPEDVTVIYKNGVEPVLSRIKAGKYEMELKPEDFRLIGTEAGNYEGNFMVRNGLRLQILPLRPTVKPGNLVKINDNISLINAKSEIASKVVIEGTSVTAVSRSNAVIQSVKDLLKAGKN